MWSTELQQVLRKACKTLVNFFLYFPEFFGNFSETKQTEAKFGSGSNDVNKLL